MIIGGLEVDDKLLAEYIEHVRDMAMSDVPIGVSVQYKEETRRALHDIILTSVRQSRYSEFSKALDEYVEKLAKKERWYT